MASTPRILNDIARRKFQVPVNSLMGQVPYQDSTFPVSGTESPNRLPGLINNTFENCFIPDGVASIV